MDYTKTAIDLSSELDVDEAQEEQRKNRFDLASKESKYGFKRPGKKAHHSNVISELDNDERIKQKAHLLSLDAYSRHTKFVNDYITFYGGSLNEFQRDKKTAILVNINGLEKLTKDKSLIDVIKEEHKFIWNEDEKPDTWARRLAKKYYDKLYREYCIVDLRIYQAGKIGMRWRTKKEVLSGKGQFVCGEKSCETKEHLASWEVNFAYMEDGQKKRALVKARLCPDCSVKLNFKHKYSKKKISKSNKKGTKRQYSDDVDSSTTHSSSGEELDEVIESQAANEAMPLPISQNSEVVHPTIDPMASSLWAQKVLPPTEALEKSREQEFDQYFQDMFL